MCQRILVAGVGNIFLGDDGFGGEVAKRLATETLTDGVRVAEFGIRGVHLAYELLDGGYDTTILVDATPRGGKPGTVYLIESDLDVHGTADVGSPDAHGMTPVAVFALLKAMGGSPGRVLVVGCEPEQTAEGVGLSESVARAVDEAVKLVVDLVRREGRPGSDSK